MAMARGEKFYKSVGIDSAIPPEMRANIVEATLRLSPALAALTAALAVLVNLGVFWRISGRQQRVGYMLFSDLVRWSTPDWLIWVLLTTGFGLFIPIDALSTIALDLFHLCGGGLFLPGPGDNGVLFQSAGDAAAGAWT